MKKIYLFAPQWQDSGRTNELYAGAIALKDYFQSISDTAVSEIQISVQQAAVIKNNILGYSILKKQLAAINTALVENRAEKVVAIGGGCGIEVPIVSYLTQQYKRLQVMWFDAHGDLNSPESSPSKYFHGMPLRFLVERQKNDIGMAYNLLDPSDVCLVGTRDLDPPEKDFIEAGRIKTVPVSTDYWDMISAAVRADVPTYIHIDLDVIDPGEYRNVKCPVLKGMSIANLERSIDHIVSRTQVIGMSIVENIETDISGLKKIQGVIERAIAI